MRDLAFSASEGRFLAVQAQLTGINVMQEDHFSKLSAFVAVAEHRHFAKAAAQLRVSPSTLPHLARTVDCCGANKTSTFRAQAAQTSSV